MSTPRRDFLAQLATASLAVAGTACVRAATSGVASAPSATPTSKASTPAVPPVPAHFDDSWTARVVAAKHKAVFDSPDVEDGRALGQAWLYRDGYQKALAAPAADVVPVIVLRHTATVLAFDDAIWARYPVARIAKVKRPEAKKKDPWPSDNPYSRPHADTDKEYAAYTLEGLLAAGAIVLACNNAFQGLTAMLARETGTDLAHLRDDVRAGLIRGVVLQPSGIYATLRAQEVGCTFMRA